MVKEGGQTEIKDTTQMNERLCKSQMFPSMP